ncbi:MAG TPA: hypothetical protein VLE73_06600 [Candidatus Saccharimonadales bacterium]|nr:hypothetical protein [Candidatus Saccharimonadales bacterium]
MSKRVVVLGGFSTGPELLEPVVNAAVGAGLAYDGEVITFPRGMKDPECVGRAVKDQLALSHSAGALVLRPYMRPSKYVAYNGPEPRSVPQLVSAATRKTFQSLGRVVSGPDRAEHARLLTYDGLELARHPVAYLTKVPRIAGFSTYANLEMLDPDIDASAVVTSGDIFFPYDPQSVPQGVRVTLVPGLHDELLIHPAEMLQTIKAVA